MDTSTRYSPEVRERAVRMVLEHEGEYPSQWAAIRSISEKIGCTAETLRRWVRRRERDLGRREGPTPKIESESRRWSERTGSSGERTRSFARRPRILHRRSSTADGRVGSLH